MVKAHKPTKWLEPAKYGRPREGPPDGGDEWQPSRFWAYDDGIFIDDLEGAQDVEFVVEPGAVHEQENELVLKVFYSSSYSMIRYASTEVDIILYIMMPIAMGR